MLTNNHKPMEILNRIESHCVTSNLVYPDRSGWAKIGIIDAEYAADVLLSTFGVERIGNKYAVKMPDGTVWYNHDGKIWAYIIQP